MLMAVFGTQSGEQTNGCDYVCTVVHKHNSTYCVQICVLDECAQHRRFPSLVIVMFYKAAANPELVSIEPVALREGTGLGSCEPLVTTVHQLIDP